MGTCLQHVHCSNASYFLTLWNLSNHLQRKWWSLDLHRSAGTNRDTSVFVSCGTAFSFSASQWGTWLTYFHCLKGFKAERAWTSIQSDSLFFFVLFSVMDLYSTYSVVCLYYFLMLDVVVAGPLFGHRLTVTLTDRVVVQRKTKCFYIGTPLMFY